MDISLTSQLEKVVEEKVASGRTIPPVKWSVKLCGCSTTTIACSKSNLSGFAMTFRRDWTAESPPPSTWKQSKPKRESEGG